jgi:hypothetical protein
MRGETLTSMRKPATPRSSQKRITSYTASRTSAFWPERRSEASQVQPLAAELLGFVSELPPPRGGLSWLTSQLRSIPSPPLACQLSPEVKRPGGGGGGGGDAKTKTYRVDLASENKAAWRSASDKRGAKEGPEGRGKRTDRD